MKKRIFIAGCVATIIGVAAVARTLSAPGREARACLAQLNGVRAGKTTEAELLSKPFFQNSPRQCSNDTCYYNWSASNEWPARLHLAPSTAINTAVQVRNGVVFRVSVYGIIAFKDSTAWITMVQVSTASCPKPCIERNYHAKQRYRPFTLSGMRVTFNGNSDIPDQMSTAINFGCLSRLRGCSSVDELLPLAGRVAKSAESGRQEK